MNSSVELALIMPNFTALAETIVTAGLVITVSLTMIGVAWEYMRKRAA